MFGNGNGLAMLVVSGMVMWFALYFFAPPMIIVGLVWLIAPRFGFDINVLWWSVGAFAFWVPTSIFIIKHG